MKERGQKRTDIHTDIHTFPQTDIGSYREGSCPQKKKRFRVDYMRVRGPSVGPFAALFIGFSRGLSLVIASV